MKVNGDKYHLLVTTEKSVSINTDGSNVANKKEQKLLGIKFDSFISTKGLGDWQIKSSFKQLLEKDHSVTVFTKTYKV